MKTPPCIHPRGSRGEDGFGSLNMHVISYPHKALMQQSNCHTLKSVRKEVITFYRHSSSRRKNPMFYNQEYFTCYFAPQRAQELLLQLLSSSSLLTAFLPAASASAALNHIVAQSLQACDKMRPEISI